MRRALRSWPRLRMCPALGPSRRRHGDVDPGEHADVDQMDVAAVAGDVDAGQVLDARAALAGAIAVGVLQDGHQGECIGAAHYRAGRNYQVNLQVAPSFIDCAIQLTREASIMFFYIFLEHYQQYLA